jgi:hypothetical protein
VPSVDLGDLDGDGDLDLVPSSFGGGFWRWYRNDGTGAFTFVDQFEAPDNPSCAVLFDADNDGDLDMGLTDEIADVVIIMRNDDQSGCTPAPQACRQPLEAGKSKLTLKDKTPDTSDGLNWKWTKGEVTAKADFGDPTSATDYELCLYENGALVHGFGIPAGDLCRRSRAGATSARASPTRIPTARRAASRPQARRGLIAGKANVKVKGKGGLLGMPDVAALTGCSTCSSSRPAAGPCFGATYSPPSRRTTGVTLLALSTPRR